MQLSERKRGKQFKEATVNVEAFLEHICNPESTEKYDVFYTTTFETSYSAPTVDLGTQ